MKSSAQLTIGDVAARFGLATHVLRHWESVGLLAPVRVAGGRRRYGDADLYRVAIILRAKEAGLGLEDIREMLTASDPASRREVFRRHRAGLARRIAEAQISLDLIDRALNCEHDDITRCPNFRRAVRDRVRLPTPLAPSAPSAPPTLPAPSAPRVG
ncbi:MerR family transcriptional regulator [Microtetraspora sp. NBRC 13810]|uniref:MerR family transcriptional regulator n=1 Tax=Microtetraspora sp. NBRC 13810 TaxID=3030990 RepID=UPI002555DA3E|nr:MerR family transcriptional regulator [Microtetraspora sp. NBRC 13810]